MRRLAAPSSEPRAAAWTELFAVLERHPRVVALIAEGDKGAVPYVVAVNEAARDLGLSAGELVKQLSAEVDGRGGGKPDLAQGSGNNPAGIDAALDALRAEVARS